MYKAVFAFGVMCLVALVGTKLIGERRRRRPRQYKIPISFKIDSFTFKSSSMSVTMKPGQSVTGTLQPVDRKGNPASVEAGSVKFTSSDESVFTVETDPENELAVTIVSVGAGVAQLDFEADADLDEGDGEIRTISGFAAIEVLPEEAVGFGITFGEPSDVAAE